MGKITKNSSKYTTMIFWISAKLNLLIVSPSIYTDSHAINTYS